MPGALEGRRNHQVNDPNDPGHTIADIDRIEDDTLWEEKTATDAINRRSGADETPRWIARHIAGKFSEYPEAMQHLPGYERAAIGFDFTRSGADPAFKAAVEAEITRLRAAHPDVTIRTRWRD